MTCGIRSSPNRDERITTHGSCAWEYTYDASTEFAQHADWRAERKPCIFERHGLLQDLPIVDDVPQLGFLSMQRAQLMVNLLNLFTREAVPGVTTVLLQARDETTHIAADGSCCGKTGGSCSAASLLDSRSATILEIHSAR